MIAPSIAGSGERLVDWLDDVAAGPSDVHFPSSGERMQFGQLWSRAARVASDLQERAREGEVAALLTNTPGSCAVFLGAMIGGVDLHSVPLPPRGAFSQSHEYWRRAGIAGEQRDLYRLEL